LDGEWVGRIITAVLIGTLIPATFGWWHRRIRDGAQRADPIVNYPLLCKLNLASWILATIMCGGMIALGVLMLTVDGEPRWSGPAVALGLIVMATMIVILMASESIILHEDHILHYQFFRKRIFHFDEAEAIVATGGSLVFKINGKRRAIPYIGFSNADVLIRTLKDRGLLKSW
jgi:hypothetical protein